VRSPLKPVGFGKGEPCFLNLFSLSPQHPSVTHDTSRGLSRQPQTFWATSHRPPSCPRSVPSTLKFLFSTHFPFTMSNSPPVPITFISSQDFVFPEDAVEQSPEVEASSSASRMGTPLVSAAAPNLKGRMTGSANSRTNSKQTKPPAPTSSNGSTKYPGNPNEQTVYSADGVVAPTLHIPGPNYNPARQAAKMTRSTPLDFSTIRTETPRTPNPPPRPQGRPRKWGLEEAPVYHPSIAEFSDPMEYIEKIAPEARQFGICKIVPPEGWRPPFAIDSEVSSSPLYLFLLSHSLRMNR